MSGLLLTQTACRQTVRGPWPGHPGVTPSRVGMATGQAEDRSPRSKRRCATERTLQVRAESHPYAPPSGWHTEPKRRGRLGRRPRRGNPTWPRGSRQPSAIKVRMGSRARGHGPPTIPRPPTATETRRPASEAASIITGTSRRTQRPKGPCNRSSRSGFLSFPHHHPHEGGPSRMSRGWRAEK